MRTWGIAAVAACGFVFGFGAGCNKKTWDPYDRGDGYEACQIDYIDVANPADLRNERSFDAKGNLTHEHIWRPAVGTIDRDRYYKYAVDRPIEVRYVGADGADYRYDRRTFNKNGDVVTYTIDGFFGGDPPLDGNIDYNEVWTYGANGKVTRIDYDDDGEGSAPAGRWDIFTYAGECWSIDEYFHDGTHDVLHYTMNAACDIQRIDWDTGGDGTIDGAEVYTYDAAGHLTRWVGTDNTTWDYTWTGDQLTEIHEPTTHWELFYACTPAPNPTIPVTGDRAPTDPRAERAPPALPGRSGGGRAQGMRF